MAENILFWEALFLISSLPARNYLFKVTNWSTKIRCENCSRLRMKTLERCQWRRSSVSIVNCEHISKFALIVYFEQANVSWVHIEKIKCEQNFLTNNSWAYTITTQISWMNQWEIFAKEFTSDIDSD